MNRPFLSLAALAVLTTLASLAVVARRMHPPNLATARSQPLPRDLSPELRAKATDNGTSEVDTAHLEAIDGLVATALEEHKLPGCVVVVGRRNQILYRKAFGARAVEPARVEMTDDTLFDLASLTKPIATATSVMILAERHLLSLDDPAAKYLPDFAAHGKQGVTLRDLLIHVSGLPADSALSDFEHGEVEAERRVHTIAPLAAPGQRLIYSDLGYLVLGDIVRKVSGETLDVFARDNIFAPLGMRDTMFRPDASAQARAAPTEQRKGAFIQGEVHDPRAFRIGGVAGHAGLFSTASDMVRFAQMILGRGALGGVRILAESSVRQMLSPHDVPSGIRALGWDVQSSYSANRGRALSRRAVGHGGYTGTALWIDPQKDLFVLFLSNRVHPDGRGAINALAGQIGTVAGESVSGERKAIAVGASAVSVASASIPKERAEPRTSKGIDVLQREGFARLRGARVGLITNDSARADDGERTLDVMMRGKVDLVALFAPEHGQRAQSDERIADGEDARLHLPVYSLYGKVLAPTATMLAGVDALVVDLPDVGARFYTYASTLHGAMKAAAAQGTRVVVLDRPNPLGGTEVEGPVLNLLERSFVNHFPLAVRHGMTLGELAEMMNAVEHLGVDLDVVRLEGWNRDAFADPARWDAPSPNLRTVDEALLYPGIALVEGTNVSVGRGTNTPFELVGAPFIDGPRLASSLTSDSDAFRGATIEATAFTPTSSTHAGVPCLGLRFRVGDRRAWKPVRAGLALASQLAALYPDAWQPGRLSEMVGNRQVTDAILLHRPLSEIESIFSSDLSAFRERRAKYLLYPPAETLWAGASPPLDAGISR